MEFDEKAYNELIEGLFARVKSFQTDGKAAYKPGLDRMMMAASLMGNPQRSYKTVHVAGTNGKGSVSNMLAVSLAAKGLRVGLYTSPHLVDFRERMRILELPARGELPPTRELPGGGIQTLISENEVMELLGQWDETFRNLEMSFFEITTALAFKWFADRKVDIAVVETGLGGRLDSTNILQSPELCVITNIGMDHCDILGDSLEEIAFEKAGIIKEGADTVIGESVEGVTEPVFVRKHHYTCQFSPKGGELVFAMKAVTAAGNAAEKNILERMDLRGSYQEKNLHTVMVSLDVLSRRGFPVSSDDPEVQDAIARTAALADFHGRWEKVYDDPTIICDIGHNSHGLKYNYKQLEDIAGASRASGVKPVLILGSVADKDYTESMKLIPEDCVIIFTSASTLRAVDASALRELFLGIRPGYDAADVTACGGVDSAASLAMEIHRKNPVPFIYVGGSSYVVADFLKWKQNNL